MPANNKTESTALADVIKTAGVLREEFRTSEDQDVSYLRMFMRCMGHAALGTEVSEDVDVPPPVNPFKLTRVLAKATFSRTERRAMLGRFKNELPDVGMLLAAFALIPYGLKQGMSKDKAFRYFATGYAGELLLPEVREEIMSRSE